MRNINSVFNPGCSLDVDLYHFACSCFAWSMMSQSPNLKGAGSIIRADTDGCLPCCHALFWAPAIGPDREWGQDGGLDGPLLCPCMAILMFLTVFPGPNISLKQN